jgi:hypothetical protein
MTTMNMGDINRRLGLGSSAVNAELLQGLGFEPVGKDKRAVLFAQSDYPAICKAVAKYISDRASVPMQPKPEKVEKAPAKAKAPPADDDEEL